MTTVLTITPLESIQRNEQPLTTGNEEIGSTARQAEQKVFNKEVSQEELLCRQLELKMEALQNQQELGKARQEVKRTQERVTLLIQRLQKAQDEKNLLSKQSIEQQEQLVNLQNKLNDVIAHNDSQLQEFSRNRQKESQQMAAKLQQLEHDKKFAAEKEDKYAKLLVKYKKDNDALHKQLAFAEESKKEQALLLTNLEGTNQLLQHELEGHQTYARNLSIEAKKNQEQKEQMLATLANTHEMLEMYQTLFAEREQHLGHITTVLQDAGYAMNSMRSNIANIKDALAKNEHLQEQLQRTHRNFLELHKQTDGMTKQLAATQEGFIATEDLLHSALDAHAILASEQREDKIKLAENEKVIAELQKSIAHYSDNHQSQKLTASIGAFFDHR